MAREPLQNASDALRKASEAAEGDAREQLYEHSDRLAKLAAADQRPDHGRLARAERKVTDAAEGSSDEVEAYVDEAIEYVHAYRETLDGV